MNVPFNEQVRILQNELFKTLDYIAIGDFYHAKYAILNGNRDIKNITEVLMRANYNGILARIIYYKYIHKLCFDPRVLWDALIIVWFFNNVWIYELEPLLNTKEFKEVLKKFRYPEWVKFGLVGGGLNELKKMGEKFSVEMDKLKENI